MTVNTAMTRRLGRLERPARSRWTRLWMNARAWRLKFSTPAVT